MANTIREEFVNAAPQTLHFTLKYTSKTGLLNSSMTQTAPYTIQLIRTTKNVRIKVEPPTDINYSGVVGALVNIATFGILQDATGQVSQWLDQGVPLNGVGATRSVQLPIPWGMGGVPKYFAIATFTLMAFSRYGALVKAEIKWNYPAANADNTELLAPNLPYVRFINSGEYIPPAVNKPTSTVNPINTTQPSVQPVQTNQTVQPVQPTQTTPSSTYGQNVVGTGSGNGSNDNKKSNTNTYLIAGGIALAAMFMLKK